MINSDSVDLYFSDSAALSDLRKEISTVTSDCHRLLLDVQLRAVLRNATLDESHIETIIRKLNLLSRKAEPIE